MAPGSPFGPSQPDAQMENAIATAIPLMFITHTLHFQTHESLTLKFHYFCRKRQGEVLTFLLSGMIVGLRQSRF
jgi:hypothetical protein